jgi:TRAP-type mannitol/chloroaromatic compound transport system permease large subunit
MLRYGYDPRLATGVIAASGTLAQIIPPSLVLIVLADVLGARSATCTSGALLPGLMLVGLYLGYVLNTLFRPHARRRCRRRRARCAVGAGWRVAGGDGAAAGADLSGAGHDLHRLGHPDRGGAMGAVGALALAASPNAAQSEVLRQALDTTAKITSFVMFILIGSTVFAWCSAASNGDLWVEHLLPACRAASWAS